MMHPSSATLVRAIENASPSDKDILRNLSDDLLLYCGWTINATENEFLAAQEHGFQFEDEEEPVSFVEWKNALCWYKPPNKSDGPWIHGVQRPHPLANLQDAVDLIEASLPGRGYIVGSGRDSQSEALGGAIIYADQSSHSATIGEGEAATPAMAACVALIQALAWAKHQRPTATSPRSH
jgi:hypothetical protein